MTTPITSRIERMISAYGNAGTSASICGENDTTEKRAHARSANVDNASRYFLYSYNEGVFIHISTSIYGKTNGA